jgi:hypothetical protein
MRMRRAGTFGLALLVLAACSGEKEPTGSEPAGPPAVTVGPAPLATTAPAAAVRPEGADAVDATLAEAKAFNAKALEDLAGIERAEARIRELAGRALEAARQGQAGRVASARAEANKARDGLVAGFAAFQTASAAQVAAVDAAVAACGGTTPAPAPAVAPKGPAPKAPGPAAPKLPAPAAPQAAGPGLATYEGCVGLTPEQGLLTQNIAALTARYEAAEAAWRQDRARLDEASATMALGR